MKLTMFFSVLFVGVQAFGGSGFYYNSKPVLTPADGSALFDVLKTANETDDEVDVCYEGSYEDAIAATEELAQGTIYFSLIDVYGESEYPPLDLEFSNDKNESAYGIIGPCH